MPLLHVLCAAPASPAEARSLLRRARMMLTPEETLLLFCDLPASDAAKAPEDDALIRLLQSGVMSAGRPRPGRFLLLVRRRSWDDARRAYLGAQQAVSPAQVAAQLLTLGRTDAAFEAATFSPSSLKGLYDAMLLMSDSLCCTPDTPGRMAAALEKSGFPCLCGRVLPFHPPQETALSRLARVRFSLSPVAEALSDRMARHNLAFPDGAVMFSREAFPSLAQGRLPQEPCPLAGECLFVRRRPDTAASLLSALRIRQARAFGSLSRRGGPGDPGARLDAFAALLPLAQLSLLLLAALLGSAPLAIAVILLPEGYALFHPRLLPGALVRLALLPARVLSAFDAGMAQLLARSPRLRVELPSGALGASGCVFAGAALLGLAFRTIYALAPLLLVCLLWLSAPLLFPALSSPLRERIPLDEPERAQLASLAEASFYTLPDAPDESAAAPRLMLAACAGCMLRLLEPDEAARRVSALLAPLEASPGALCASEISCLLASAQYLRERMSDCDAALRPLPARLEALARACPPPEDDGLLAGLLRLCQTGDSSAPALDALRAFQPPHAKQPDGLLPQTPSLDALFLPFGYCVSSAPMLMPLTHPHAFLRAHFLEIGKDAAESAAAVDRFLVLAAALGLPFGPLLLRSPVVAPYAPVLMQL
ncbi:MAG: hypothetical protein Q4G52_05395 [Clostridia bacterium]|nr:hypothetical protein [Clostridia bacterium]